MSNHNIAKSQSLVRSLIDLLSKRLPAYTFSEQLTPVGDTLMISQSASPTAGQNNCAIRIGFQDTQFNDVIGLPQNIYSPMRADVIEESTAASASVSLCTLTFQLAINVELDRMGVKQRWYLNPNGTVPAISEFAADGSVSAPAVKQLDLSPDAYWPLSGQ